MFDQLTNIIDEVRLMLASKFASGEFSIDKSRARTVELNGVSFVADQPAIFGLPNQDYINREINWYLSQSLNVNDIPNTPAIWKQCASDKGEINSNYGYLLFSQENGNQYYNVLKELQENPWSRRAVAIYTRPSIWKEYNRDGMSDFICTNAVQYFVREDHIYAVVQMRSNDAVFGFNNDRAWQQYVLNTLANDLGLLPGSILWQAGSLHVYERHFYLLHHYIVTGEPYISLSDYRNTYPNTDWAKS